MSLQTALATAPEDTPPALTVLPDYNAAVRLPDIRNEDESRVWSGLSDTGKWECLFWEDDVKRIQAAGHGTRGRILSQIATRRGLTPSAVRNKFDRWQREGWPALVNRSRHKASSTVPYATIEFYRGLCHGHQRQKTTASAAWRILVARWKAWVKEGGLPGSECAIPGYITPPRALHGTDLPAGWSKEQWLKRAPDQAARTQTAQGNKAYSAFLPAIRTTRVGIKPGEVVFFDDEEQDIYVNFLGAGKQDLMRPLAFHALDLNSGCNLFRNFKPQLMLEDGRRKLSQSDFYWFTFAFLTQVGYREDTGTLLVGEMGTAAWGREFREALEKLTQGKVRFDHSGRYGDPAFRGALFEGKSCGNFRFKAPVESGFKIIRDYTSLLPGATGRNRDLAPEESYGLARYNKWTLDLIQTLPLERAMLVKMPVLEWCQFTKVGHDIVEAINRRTDHELEGWAQCEYAVQTIRMDGKEIRLIPEVLKNATPEDMEFFTRMGRLQGMTCQRLSPREVWDLTPKKAFRKPRPWWIADLMGLRHARRVTVTQKLELQIKDREIDPDPLRYVANCTNAEGHAFLLNRGQEYLVWLNPYDPSHIQVGDARKGHEGRWLGQCELIPRHNRLEEEAIHKQIGYLTAATASERLANERQSIHKLAERTVAHRWNQRLADTSKPLTPGEHAAAAAAEEATEAMEEIAAMPARKGPADFLPDPFG